MHSPSSSPPRDAARGLLPGFNPSDVHQPLAPPMAGPKSAANGKFSIYQDAPELPSMSNYYPSPLPTSALDASSSPHGSPKSSSKHADDTTAAIGTVSTASVASRAALASLALIKLPLTGAEVTVGRSSKSSTVALTATNKLISRVHAKLWYHSSHLVVIECLGWNGLTVSVPSFEDDKRVYKEYPVVKNQTIYIEHIDGITLDIHGDRALIEFEVDTTLNSDSTEVEVGSDDAENWQNQRSSPPPSHAHNALDSSPVASPARSPVLSAQLLESAAELVQAVEDRLSAEPELETVEESEPVNTTTEVIIEAEKPVEVVVSEPVPAKEAETPVVVESIAEPKVLPDVQTADEIKKTEEPVVTEISEVIQIAEPVVESNDVEMAEVEPVTNETKPAEQKVEEEVHEVVMANTSVQTPRTPVVKEQSVIDAPAPQPDIIAALTEVQNSPTPSARAEAKAKKANRSHTPLMGSPRTTTPKGTPRANLSRTHTPKATPDRFDRHKEGTPEPTNVDFDREEVAKIVTNFVAFSRVASIPLSTIVQSSKLLQTIPYNLLEQFMETISSIGVVHRVGKDAVGHVLEPEYYYMVENDSDMSRRQLVEQTRGKRTLRECRKTHKQYFYKRPKK